MINHKLILKFKNHYNICDIINYDSLANTFKLRVINGAYYIIFNSEEFFIKILRQQGFPESIINVESYCIINNTKYGKCTLDELFDFVEDDYSINWNKKSTNLDNFTY